MVHIERQADEIRAILKQLTELQEVDRELAQVRQQLAILPGKLKALDARLAQEAHEIGTFDAGKSDTAEARRKLEKQLREVEGEIAEHQKRAMQCKTNKELAAVNLEIDKLRAREDAIETQILELIEREDSHDRKVTQAHEKLERLKAELQEERTRIEEQARTKKEKIARLDAERQRQRKTIAADALALYDRLSQRIPGDVVCPARRNTCGGCHMSLVNQKMVEIRQMKRFIQCEGCLRIFSGEAEA